MNELVRPGLAQVRMTVDVVAFTIEDGALKVLLIKRADEPFKDHWALPGGFLWAGESTAEAARRLLEAKAGVPDLYIEQLYTFDDPKRDPRGPVISVTYFALVNRDALVMRKTEGTQRPALLPVEGLPDLAFDHGDIVRYAQARLAGKLGYTNLVYSLLPAKFTFAQLQSVYEEILGRPVDRRNFRKKYMSLGLIRATGERQGGARHRPAELFEFVSREAVELNRWF